MGSFVSSGLVRSSVSADQVLLENFRIPNRVEIGMGLGLLCRETLLLRES